MSSLTLIKTISPVVSTETKLYVMKDLQQQIKELQAEFDMLKKEVIEEHFIQNEEYRTDKGLLLASYKACEMALFQQSKFKLDHSDIYNMYSEKKVIHKFLIK